MIVVITNGVFEWLHRGHVAHLAESRRLGDRLVVLLNSDDSARKCKGRAPAVWEQDRACVLEACRYVDQVLLFDEPEPTAAIQRMISLLGGPNVILTKGADYAGVEIAGAKEVIRAGGKVVTTPPSIPYHASDLRQAAAENRGVLFPR